MILCYSYIKLKSGFIINLSRLLFVSETVEAFYVGVFLPMSQLSLDRTHPVSPTVNSHVAVLKLSTKNLSSTRSRSKHCYQMERGEERWKRYRECEGREVVVRTDQSRICHQMALCGNPLQRLLHQSRWNHTPTALSSNLALSVGVVWICKPLLKPYRDGIDMCYYKQFLTVTDFKFFLPPGLWSSSDRCVMESMLFKTTSLA